MSPTMANSTNVDPDQDLIFLDNFESSLESLHSSMQYKYSEIRKLDQSLLALQNQNKQLCEQELEEMKKAVACGLVKLDNLYARFSDEALEEQKHCLEIADAKISFALDAYDKVDQKIQQLDEYLIQYGALRREGEVAATATGEASLNVDTSNTVTKSGRGIRKKYKSRVPGEGDVGKLHTLGLQLDLPVDPNEPTYCVCKQVSFGKMVACDNPACAIEWFHFGCVGLDEQPKGKWFCSDCASTMKRGKRR